MSRLEDARQRPTRARDGACTDGGKSNRVGRRSIAGVAPGGELRGRVLVGSHAASVTTRVIGGVASSRNPPSDRLRCKASADEPGSGAVPHSTERPTCPTVPRTVVSEPCVVPVASLNRRCTSTVSEADQAPQVTVTTHGAGKRADDGDGFLLTTSSANVIARHVVIASGGYQKPHRPAGADQLPASLLVIDAEDYANPDALPAGKVLVVGSGQTGCQVAEELLEAGREVFLACGRAPGGPRRLDGRGVVGWISETSFLDMTLADLPSPLARLGANVQALSRRCTFVGAPSRCRGRRRPFRA
jgi:Pyridine nucleotide-disulphide oxidoreductase